MASDRKNSGTIRACTPREFENLLRGILHKSHVTRPSSLRIVWSRPLPAVEVDPFEDEQGELFEQ